jgi:hypothetical protein
MTTRKALYLATITDGVVEFDREATDEDVEALGWVRIENAYSASLAHAMRQEALTQGVCTVPLTSDPSLALATLGGMLSGSPVAADVPSVAKEATGSNGHGEAPPERVAAAPDVRVTSPVQIGWTTASDGTREPVMGMRGAGVVTGAKGYDTVPSEFHRQQVAAREAKPSEPAGSITLAKLANISSEPRKLPSVRLLEIYGEWIKDGPEPEGDRAMLLAATRLAIKVVGQYLDEEAVRC